MELYDPVAGTFGLTELFGRAGLATATVLADGRVLIVGGNPDPTTAKLYDPATGTLSLTGTPNVAHRLHTATLLPDGRVLIVAGDIGSSRETHAFAEIYEPVTGIFTLTGSLNEDRSGHTATLLLNGQVLIIGGTQIDGSGSGISLSSCELYNPITGIFSPTGSLSQPHPNHTATLFTNGQVLVAEEASQA